MFWTRLISGIFLIIFTFFTMMAGGSILLLTLFAISVIGLFELYRVMKFEKAPLGWIGYVSTGLWYLILFYGMNGKIEVERYFMLLFSTFVILLLFVFVIAYPKYSAIQLFSAVFGFLYVPMMLSFIFQTRESISFGKWLVWLIYVSSWGSDTCAYVVGRLIGKRKLAPILSPKKSVEGSIGGILGSALLGGLLAFFMFKGEEGFYSLLFVFMIISGVGSMISQIGDLAASGIKRNFDVKDYGRLIPGHGGILDRFDSIIITAPIIYFLSSFLLGGMR